MKFEDYIHFDGLGLADLVRTGQVTPEDLKSTALEAIARLNPKINAVLETWPDENVCSEVGPDDLFYGVPFLIKDLVIQRQGKLLEMGSRLAKGLIAPSNSFLMNRIDRLGFQTIGRTTTPELGHGCTTESVSTGPTRNPWDLSRMAGGSSGGSAAAVAAGILPIAHGNDGAGSIRIPAACCGVVGLKPSRGRVSSGPNAAEGLFGMGAELALSKSVRDMAAMLAGVSGPMPGDPFIIAPYHTQPMPKSFKIAFTTTPWYDAPIDHDVISVVDTIARLCETLGHTVEEASPQFDYMVMRDACIKSWAAGMALWIDSLVNATGREANDQTLESASLAMYHYGKSLKADQIIQAMDGLNKVSRSIGPFFDDYDILITPSLATPPALLGTYNQNQPVTGPEDWFDRKAKLPPFIAAFNVTGQPAITLPLGMSADGLPIGVQFVAPFGREDILLSIAATLEQAVPWADRLEQRQLQLWSE